MNGLTPNRIALLAASATALAVVFVHFLPEWLWLQVVVGGILMYATARVLLRVWVYKRLRNVERQIIQAMAQRDISTRWMGSDPLQNIQLGIQELMAASQRELLQLKQLEHFRREFIGDVSHELKTPLFAIQGFIETLLDGALNDKNVNTKFLKQALKNTQRLNNLVQDLLVISQLEAGELKMNPERFRLYELVLDVVDELDYKLTTKGRNIALQLQPNGLETTLVRADRERIRQVLVNLVDNAITYGRPDGHIHLELQTVEDKLRVTVRDDGPGIESEHLPFLFSRFYRVEKSRNRAMGGTGLGLAIVKNLVEAHNEQVAVDSKVGQGTSFEFTLPLA